MQIEVTVDKFKKIKYNTMMKFLWMLGFFQMFV